ncbi:MAG: hypothetical protein ACR2OZ_14325 [Verrucomicrobiales bacterium]
MNVDQWQLPPVAVNVERRSKAASKPQPCGWRTFGLPRFNAARWTGRGDKRMLHLPNNPPLQYEVRSFPYNRIYFCALHLFRDGRLERLVTMAGAKSRWAFAREWTPQDMA